MNEMLARLQASRDRQQRFVSDASHELRSPLASIRQAAEVARTHPGAMPEGELADAVLQESVRMQRIVEQMLVLTRTDERGVHDRREVGPRRPRADEAARVRREGLTVDISGVSAGRVAGDPAALSQVVRNLVENAARHARSRVDCISTDVGRPGAAARRRRREGVPTEERVRVFERFVRLDEARSRDDGGSGLGLAIVQEIVAAHGGTASVTESALGGASFVVTCLRDRLSGAFR